MLEKEIRYLDFIKSRFPQITVTKVDFNLKQEKYSDIITVNDETVFQFSKYDWTLANFENELKAIPFIRQFVSMPMPEMERIDRQTVKYNSIKGTPLIRDKILMLSPYYQDHIAEQLGVFLKQLHGIHVPTAKLNGLDNCPVGFTRDDWLSEYREIQQKVFQYCDSHTREYIHLVFRQLTDNELFLFHQPALIHADLTPEHIIFDEDAKAIKAITGFSLSGFGDPAYDIAAILSMLGEGFTKRLARFYRNLDAMINRARFYACAGRLLWAKNVAEMIAIRDLSNLQFSLDERDIMPIGSKL